MGVKYIARISKPGYSVYDPDPKNFSLREDTNSPKSFIRGKCESLPGEHSAGTTVTHNLGYHPFCLGYLIRHENNRAIPCFWNAIDDVQASVGGTWDEYPASPAGYTFYYDIYYEGG
jgi:hypothetical protein